MLYGVAFRWLTFAFHRGCFGRDKIMWVIDSAAEYHMILMGPTLSTSRSEPCAALPVPLAPRPLLNIKLVPYSDKLSEQT